MENHKKSKQHGENYLWWWNRLKTGEKVATILAVVGIFVAILAVPGVMESLHLGNNQSEAPAIRGNAPPKGNDSPRGEVEKRQDEPKNKKTRPPATVKPLENPPPQYDPKWSMAAPLPPVDLTPEEADALLIKKVDVPQLGASDQEFRVQGTVVLKVFVWFDGSVASTQIVEGPPVLARVASNTVKQWQYKPYVLDGSTRSFNTTVTVVFDLKSQPKQ